MYLASDKLKKKGFNIGSECYIFFNGKIVKVKIIDGDFIAADDFLNPTDFIRPFVQVKVLPIDIPKINNWQPETVVNINQLYKTYEEAEKNRKLVISVNEFIEGNENVHKNNIIARVNVKTLTQYKKLKDHIDETYIINDNENHIYEDIKDFPCTIIIIEIKGTDILKIERENIIKKFSNFSE
jgi:hypothetical protein